MASGNNQQPWLTRAAQAIRLVEGNVGRGILMPVRDLFNTLGLGLVQKEDFGRLVTASYGIAKRKNYWSWVEQAQLEAVIHFEKQWILDNIPHKYKHKNRVSVTKKTVVQPIHDILTPCTDIRYCKDNATPSMPAGGNSELENENWSFSEPEDIELQPGVLSPKQITVTVGAQASLLSGNEHGDVRPGCSKEFEHSAEMRIDENVKITVAENSPSGISRQVSLSQPPSAKSRIESKITGAMCPYVGCNARTRSLRTHTIRARLPRLFNDEVKGRILDDPAFQARRIEALGVLRGWLLGCVGPIEGLMGVIKDSPCLRGDCVVTSRASKGMVALCTYMGWEVPNQFRLRPMSSPACLIHWRCLVAALNLVTNEQRTQFFSRFKGSLLGKKKGGSSAGALPGKRMESASNVPAEIPQKVNQVLHSSQTSSGPSREKMEIDTAQLKLPAIDSHMHLDRLMGKFRGRVNTDVYTLNDALSLNLRVSPVNPVDIVGAVAVYCDPLEFPRVLPLDPKLRFAIGVHPKKVRQLTPAVEHEFCTLLANPRVSALGEIGLDLTEPRDLWSSQEKAFCSLLSYACVRKPLVLHLRGNESVEGAVLYSRALSVVRQYCGSLQPIHLHCFTGVKKDVQDWLGSFPNCYFGFTALVDSFSREQRSGLFSVPKDRILIESDAPYFPTHTSLSFGTPAFIGDVGERVARRKGMQYGELMHCSLENAKRLSIFHRLRK